MPDRDKRTVRPPATSGPEESRTPRGGERTPAGWIRSGRLRSVTSGRRRLVPVAALAEYVASLETAA